MSGRENFINTIVSIVKQGKATIDEEKKTISLRLRLLCCLILNIYFLMSFLRNGSSNFYFRFSERRD